MKAHRLAGVGAARGAAALVLLAVTGTLACDQPAARAPNASSSDGSSGTETDGRSRKSLEPCVSELPLGQYLPPPGLRWVVEMSPERLTRSDPWKQLYEAYFDAQQVREFVGATGMDPLDISKLYLADYELGQVTLLEASRVGEQVVKTHLSRARSYSSLSTRCSNLRAYRLVVARRPTTLLHLEGRFVALIRDDPSLAKIMIAKVRGELDDLPSALDRAGLSKHAQQFVDSPLRAFALGPFPQATSPVVRGLADGVLSAELSSGDAQLSLALRGRARGAWEFESNDSATQWLQALLTRPEARALGWHRTTRGPKAECGQPPEGLTLCKVSGQWRALDLLETMRRVTSGELTDLFGD